MEERSMLVHPPLSSSSHPLHKQHAPSLPPSLLSLPSSVWATILNSDILQPPDRKALMLTCSATYSGVAATLTRFNIQLWQSCSSFPQNRQLPSFAQTTTTSPLPSPAAPSTSPKNSVSTSQHTPLPSALTAITRITLDFQHYPDPVNTSLSPPFLLWFRSHYHLPLSRLKSLQLALPPVLTTDQLANLELHQLLGSCPQLTQLELLLLETPGSGEIRFTLQQEQQLAEGLPHLTSLFSPPRQFSSQMHDDPDNPLSTPSAPQPSSDQACDLDRTTLQHLHHPPPTLTPIHLEASLLLSPALHSRLKVVSYTIADQPTSDAPGSDPSSTSPSHPYCTLLTQLPHLSALKQAHLQVKQGMVLPLQNFTTLTGLIMEVGAAGGGSGTVALQEGAHPFAALTPHSSMSPSWAGISGLSHMLQLSITFPKSTNSSMSAIPTIPPAWSSLHHLTNLHLSNALVPSDSGLHHLPSLLHLTLQFCTFRPTPLGLAASTPLQSLKLLHCSVDPQVPEPLSTFISFQHLQQLDLLQLSEFQGMEFLPSGIGLLIRLTQMFLSGCYELRDLPDGLCYLTQLLTLEIGGAERLAALPARIGNLSRLETLTVYGCSSLAALPDSLGHLSALHTLDLDECEELETLPESIGRLSVCLKDMSLRGCKCSEMLPDAIGHLRQLTTLSFYECKSLHTLPDSLGRLSALVELSAESCAALASLPEALSGLNKLRVLYLHDCASLKHLPDSIGKLRSLILLSLDGCESLQALPHSVGQLSQLKQLSLFRCASISALPDSIGDLRQLQQLDLRGCRRLMGVPSTMALLSRLQRLDVIDNKWGLVKQLAGIAGNWTQLQHITLQGHQIMQAGGFPEVEKCRSLTCLAEMIPGSMKLQQLTLSNWPALQQLPPTIGDLRRLRELNLCHLTGLSHLPDSIGQLGQLRVLNISGCQELVTLPASIGCLQQLQRLAVLFCRALQSLPGSIGDLYQLQSLQTSGSQELQQLPDSIGHLQQLKLLRVTGCFQLLALPATLGLLEGLEVLQLSSCHSLSHLPDSVSQLVRLEVLDLSNCRALEVLPAGLSNLGCLERLYMRECPAAVGTELARAIQEA